MTEVAIILFTVVVWLAKGHYDPSAPLLVITFLFWVYSKFSPTFDSRVENIFSPVLRTFDRFAFLAVTMFAVKPNLIYVDTWIAGYKAYRAVPAFLVSLNFRIPLKRLLIPLFVVFYLSVLFFSPHPHIDVFHSNTLAVNHWLNGLNPYSQVYPDIYQGAFDYHPGFLYWPGALYLQTLSKLLFHDIRAVLALAWALAAYFVPIRNRVLWLTLPFAAFGVEQGWLDPILSFCAALCLWAIQNRRYSWVAIAIATAASIKQYGFLIGLFSVGYLWLLERKTLFYKTEAFKTACIAAFIFIAALLPFIVWNFQDFIEMTVLAHAGALARPDALNFTAFWMKTTGLDFPGIAQLAFTLLGFVLAGLHLYRNIDKGVRVIAESWAIAFGFSILFGKFAFCNYHWLLISFWILSLAPRTQIAGGDKAQV